MSSDASNQPGADASDLPDAPEQDARPNPPLLLRRDQVTLVVLAVVLAGWLAWDWLDVSRWGAAPVEMAELAPEKFGLVLDVNAATWVELSQLPGIGEKIAKRIVEGRAAAPYRSVDDLRRVRGIGPKLLERVRPYVCVTTEPTQETDRDP